MKPLRVRFTGPASRLHGILQSLNRLETGLEILFIIGLVIGTVFWDEMAFQLAPLSPTGWAGIALWVSLSVLLVSLCERKWPLLLCAAVLVAIRLPFTFAGSAAPDRVQFIVDCFAVCIPLSAIVFRIESAKLSRSVRESFGARPSQNQPASQPHPLIAAPDQVVVAD